MRGLAYARLAGMPAPDVARVPICAAGERQTPEDSHEVRGLSSRACSRSRRATRHRPRMRKRAGLARAPGHVGAAVRARRRDRHLRARRSRRSSPTSSASRSWSRTGRARAPCSPPTRSRARRRTATPCWCRRARSRSTRRSTRSCPTTPPTTSSAVAYVADIPLVLVVHPSLPVQSIPDLIKYAKDNPGKLSYASSGTGTTLHLSGEMLKSMTGIQMTHVPYKGGPPALNDVVAGHVQLVFADPVLGDPADPGRPRPPAGRDLDGAAAERARHPADRRRRRARLRGGVVDRVHGAGQDAGGGRRPAARGTDGAGGNARDARAGHQARHGSRHITVTRRVARLPAAARSPAGANWCSRPASPARNSCNSSPERNELLNIGL